MDELLGLGFKHSDEEEAQVERVTLDEVKKSFFDTSAQTTTSWRFPPLKLNRLCRFPCPVLSLLALWGRTGYRPVEYVSIACRGWLVSLLRPSDQKHNYQRKLALAA